MVFLFFKKKVADEAFSWTVVECGMYFSAACLIGMRPLLSPIIERLPTSFRLHLLHPTKNTKGSAFGSGAHDRMRLKSYYRQRAQYASVRDGEDAEAGLEGGEVSMPLPLHHAGRPYLVLEGDDIRRDIRVETKVEVRRDQDRSFPRQAKENAGAYIYGGQVHNEMGRSGRSRLESHV